MHLAPRCDGHDMGDTSPAATFQYVAQELGRRKLAFLCARESQAEPRLGPSLKKQFGGVYIANEGLDKSAATRLIDIGEADAVAFGKLIIANPDLVRRFQEDAPLNAWDMNTFYAAGPKGYTDYPALAAV
ncbi:MAG: alkene reductase, partial [Elusimicrobiota bacterium]